METIVGRFSELEREVKILKENCHELQEQLQNAYKRIAELQEAQAKAEANDRRAEASSS